MALTLTLGSGRRVLTSESQRTSSVVRLRWESRRVIRVLNKRSVVGVSLQRRVNEERGEERT